jgi:hypothetical protein
MPGCELTYPPGLLGSGICVKAPGRGTM